MKTCCEHHGMPDGCRQGRDCPARAPVPNAEGAQLQFRYVMLIVGIVLVIACAAGAVIFR